MKKIILSAILAALTISISNATVLFPFFGDLAPVNKLVARVVYKDFEQVVYKGDSGWGGVKECVEFLNDVLPEDVNKKLASNGFVVFTSTFHPKEIDTIEDSNKVSAIYIVQRKGGVEIYYTESDAHQQAEWQDDIENGAL